MGEGGTSYYLSTEGSPPRSAGTPEPPIADRARPFQRESARAANRQTCPPCRHQRPRETDGNGRDNTWNRNEGNRSATGLQQVSHPQTRRLPAAAVRS